MSTCKNQQHCERNSKSTCLVTQRYLHRLGHMYKRWLIRQLFRHQSQQFLQSFLLHPHLDPTTHRPKVGRTAARRVGKIRVRSVTVENHQVRFQVQTSGPEAKSSRGSDVSGCRDEAKDEDCVLKLPVLHATNSHFRNVGYDQMYRLVNNSQRYNEKLAARKGKYVKRMKSLVKPCMFDD